MSATVETQTESQAVKKTVESCEEAKMEPTVSEQPQTEQPAPVEIPVQHQHSEQASQPGASSLPTAASLEGTPVDEPSLLEHLGAAQSENVESENVESENVGMNTSGKTEDSSNALLHEFSHVKSGVEEKSFEEKFNALSEKIDAFDPVSLFEDSKVVPSQGEDIASETSSLFSKDINDESLIDDLIKDAETDSGNVDEIAKKDKSKNVADGSDEIKIGDECAEGCELSKTDITASETGTIGVNADDKIAKNDVEKEKLDDMIENEVSMSTVEGIDNGLEVETNGELITSTESEGYNGDQNSGESGEAVETKTVTDGGNENKETNSGQKKTESGKSETPSSPTKSAKPKKKEDKSIEHILKALSSLQTTEEKLAALCKKYADLHEEHRVLQTSFKQSQRKLAMVSREKDQLQTEHTKAVMAKSKLESLCRELQKHNQTIRQESIQRAKEEDEKRKEISQKFQTTISEIQQQMQENHDRNKQLREENYELANKLKKFIEQYEAREKQVEKVIQHRELEQKLADAKLEQASAILMEEKGKNQKEKEMLLLQSTEFMKKLQIKDAELQMYKERYEEFQSTISKSEEMFQKFKTEMEKMNKRTKKLEKDGAQWKVKWENANRALLEMADEKTKYDKEKSIMLNKISKLESLCRAMQAERQARKMIDTDSVDSATLEKVSNLIPPEVRQTPLGGESLSVAPKDIPLPSGETPDVEPGPSEPSPSCTELETNNPDDSLDSGDTELTGTTVIPKEPTIDTESNNTESGHSENQAPSENQSDRNQPQEVNQSTNQDGGSQTCEDESASS